MNVLLDTNVVLDVLLVRQPWYPEAAQVWDAHRDGRLTGTVAVFALPTTFYIVRRQADLQRANDGMRVCLHTLEIAPVRRATLELARTFPGNDFQDNLQIACATEARLDASVTRNPSDFANATVPVLLPVELLGRLAQGTS